MEQMDADCIVKHINTFLHQARDGLKADFGEPCANCSYALKDCNFDWLSRMKEVVECSAIPIQLVKQERCCK